MCCILVGSIATNLAPDVLSSDPNAVLVINLKTSRERLAYMEAQLATYNRSFTRLDAVDGPTIDIKDMHKRGLIGHTHFQEMMGTLGCALSHHKAWTHVAEGNLPWVLILEDDVAILQDPSHFPGIPDNTELVWLHRGEGIHTRYQGGEFSRNLSVEPGTRVLEPGAHPAYGAVGYLLSLSGARKLLACGTPVPVPVDSLLFHHKCFEAGDFSYRVYAQTVVSQFTPVSGKTQSDRKSRDEV